MSRLEQCCFAPKIPTALECGNSENGFKGLTAFDSSLFAVLTKAQKCAFHLIPLLVLSYSKLTTVLVFVTYKR